MPGALRLPGLQNTPVGRIRRLRRHPAYMLKEIIFSCRFYRLSGAVFFMA
ncbi:Hypothetical protein ABZS17H1_04224 [Kosakonia cowanii]